MSTLVVVGAQWGDEGKGKVVDALASRADLVARYAGGNNAGHTLVLGDRKIVTHLIPSGCAYPGTLCVLGAGMVIDPEVFHAEVAALQRGGMLQQGELRVSLDAHVIFSFHRRLDGLREDLGRGSAKIGTTRRGIGPAYEAKAGRRGIRVRDLFQPARVSALLELNRDRLDPELISLGGPSAGVDVAAEAARAAGWAQSLRPLACDVGALVDDAIRSGQRVLIEGAQGALLDLDHGTYPYVTSSTTLAGGACAGLGIGPMAIKKVWGITKAYATRVGAGPFPSRVDGELGDLLRREGGEFGATTGRPRDCGWLDLPALRYAARTNGLSGLCVTKLDVLAAMPEAWICAAYEGGVAPGADELDQARPVLERLRDWGDPRLVERVKLARRLVDLPPPVRDYLDRIVEFTGVPLALVSVGASREQTIFLEEAF
ncbi:MAG: adenylosuccinate synthase [Nannocystis sp.]|nr:adenylosuccinate synthase [Nannocystis sp.]